MSDPSPPPIPARSALKVVRCAVVTVSDSRTPETDYGGRTVAYTLVDAKHHVVRRWIVKDDPGEIRGALDEGFEDPEVDAIFLTGGTGIRARDYTYEVVEKAIDKRIDGFGEIFRYLAFKEIGSAAMLTRAVAGVAFGKLVVALPSSPDVCKLAMEKLLLPELVTIITQIRK